MRRRESAVGSRIMNVVMGLMIFIVVLGTTGSAFAVTPNITDSSWAFTLSVDRNPQYVDKREKYDSSKVYINWSSYYGGTINSIIVSPYGYDVIAQNYMPAGTSAGGSKFYYIYNTGKYSLTNYIHELGYFWASFSIKSMSGAGAAKGVWSPDSAGTYTVLR